MEEKVIVQWALTTLILFFMAMAQLRADLLTPYNVIYDIGFDVFPQIYAWPTTTFFASIVDVWIIVSYGTFLFVCFFWLEHKAKVRFLICLSLVYAMRTLTLLATRYPLASASITNEPYRAPNVFLSSFLVMIGMRTTQLDYMFSGHTAVWTLASLFVAVYGKSRVGAILYALFNLAGVFLILAMRMHYTADVLVGFFISSLLFFVYHVGCRDNKERIPTLVRWFRWLDDRLVDL